MATLVSMSRLALAALLMVVLAGCSSSRARCKPQAVHGPKQSAQAPMQATPEAAGAPLPRPEECPDGT